MRLGGPKSGHELVKLLLGCPNWIFGRWANGREERQVWIFAFASTKIWSVNSGGHRHGWGWMGKVGSNLAKERKERKNSSGEVRCKESGREKKEFCAVCSCVWVNCLCYSVCEIRKSKSVFCSIKMNINLLPCKDRRQFGRRNLFYVHRLCHLCHRRHHHRGQDGQRRFRPKVC